MRNTHFFTVLRPHMMNGILGASMTLGQVLTDRRLGVQMSGMAEMTGSLRTTGSRKRRRRRASCTPRIARASRPPSRRRSSQPRRRAGTLSALQLTGSPAPNVMSAPSSRTTCDDDICSCILYRMRAMHAQGHHSAWLHLYAWHSAGCSLISSLSAADTAEVGTDAGHRP